MGTSGAGLTNLLKAMENNDRTGSSGESLTGGEVDLEDNDKEINQELKLGTEFSSLENSYLAYVKYAAKMGFNVRKQHRKSNKAGFITRVTYCCSKEGHRRSGHEPVSYSLPISRVGCEAQVICHLEKNGKYKIVSFNRSHNHELIQEPMKHLLRVNRCKSRPKKSHVDDSTKSRKPIVGREAGGQENLGSVDKDCGNCLRTKRKVEMEKGDAGAILQYFQSMREDSSSYFHSMQLDEDDKLTNIFWADARSIRDYDVFGDVICFDTTYRINEYGRPFAQFIGVNHHKQIVVFGSALLYDDTLDSFKWLFETFLAAVSGKQPKTILTDQSDEMAKAISEVFPQAHHRLCAWHVYQNSVTSLDHVLHGSKQFASDLSKCVFDYEDEDEWVFAWNDMLENYGLKENKWLKGVFEVRKKWALVYDRHTFTADLMSVQQSESMTSVMKKHLMPSHNLLCFFEHYEKVLADRRHKDLEADFKMMQTIPLLLTDAEMLRHAVEVYTPEVFKLFEREYMGILNCSVYKVGKSGMTGEYRVCYSGRSQEQLVKFDASTQEVTCSCMKFTFVGILCTHALKVLDKKNVKRIPPDYILNRWRRDAEARTITSYHEIETSDNPEESIEKRYKHLYRNFQEIASFAAEDEKLTAYAHDYSIQLLKGLEEMKKNLGLDNSRVNENAEGEAPRPGSRSEHAKTINGNACEITKERGVKRKQASRCQCSTSTDRVQKQKHTPQTRNKQEATRNWLSVQGSASNDDSSKQQHDIGDGYPPFEGLSHGSYGDTRSQVSLPSSNSGATINLQSPMPFSQQPQGFFIANGTQMSYPSRDFGASTTFQHNIAFPQMNQQDGR